MSDLGGTTTDALESVATGSPTRLFRWTPDDRAADLIPVGSEGWSSLFARYDPNYSALASDDDREAAQATIDVLGALWPGEVPDEWWSTPVGRLCARSLGTDPEAVTHSVAAAMLGVTRGTIATWVHRGDLDRHPDGGVLRGSVMQRLARGT